MKYSLCVSPLINVLLISADAPDSLSCFLFAHEMMGRGNRENDCTSEGCKLGKARLRTNWPYGSLGWEERDWNWRLAAHWTSVRLLSFIFTLMIHSAFWSVDVFCASLTAWLFLSWIGSERWHRADRARSEGLWPRCLDYRAQCSCSRALRVSQACLVFIM